MSLRAETFENDLNHRLGGGYRLRWSPKKLTWMIEQKVARTQDVPVGGQADLDRWQRAKDGYALVMEVAPQPVMKCQWCQSALTLPVMKTGEIRCDTCHKSKARGSIIYYAGYFPLCEKLLQHLESTSPKRGYRWLMDMQRENRDRQVAWEEAFYAERGAELLDYRNVIAKNAWVGAGRGPASLGRSF